MRHRNCVEVVTDYRDRCLWFDCLWFDGLEMAILTQVNRKRAIEFFRKLNPETAAGTASASKEVFNPDR